MLTSAQKKNCSALPVLKARRDTLANDDRLQILRLVSIKEEFAHRCPSLKEGVMISPMMNKF
jgi:hypothetical protein